MANFLLRCLQLIYEILQEVYWDLQAEKLHKRRIKNVITSNHPLYKILEKYKPKSILDVGCGTGSLFNLYKRMGIKDIVGIDISGKALKIAKKYHPDVTLIRGRIESVKLERTFDLAVCNRSLQHVTPRNIKKAIKNICDSSRVVILNELTDSDGVPERIIIYKHNYLYLFESFGFELVETGKIGKGTWMVFKKSE